MSRKRSEDERKAMFAALASAMLKRSSRKELKDSKLIAKRKIGNASKAFIDRDYRHPKQYKYPKVPKRKYRMKDQRPPWGNDNYYQSDDDPDVRAWYRLPKSMRDDIIAVMKRSRKR